MNIATLMSFLSFGVACAAIGYGIGTRQADSAWSGLLARLTTVVERQYYVSPLITTSIPLCDKCKGTRRVPRPIWCSGGHIATFPNGCNLCERFLAQGTTETDPCECVLRAEEAIA